jgi:hypothetical protein
MNAERADLEARFAAPVERDLPPGRHRLHREILMNDLLTQPPPSHPTRPGASRSWRPPGRVLAAVAAGTAVAAGVGAYAITAGDAPAAEAPAAASHPPTSHARTGQAVQQAVLAARVLRAAAAHLAREGVTSEPSPGQWIYFKCVDYGYPGLVGPSGVTTDQEWITFDGIGTAYYDHGQLVTHTSPIAPPPPTATPWDAWNTDPTPGTAYEVLAALPTDPQALLKVIASQAASQNAESVAVGNPIAGVAPKTEAQREFDYLTLILWNAAIGIGGPPAAEAAAYQAIASLPGITVQQGIEDVAGGQAIGVSDDGGYDQLLIDPASYQVIGLRQLSTGTEPTGKEQSTAAPAGSVRRANTGTRSTSKKPLAAAAEKKPGLAYPPKGTLIQEIVYAQTAEVAAPGDR